MELLSTETKTAEIKTPNRSRLETSTFSVATSSALKPRLPRTQQAPAWARRGSSSPPATCRLYLRSSNVGLRMSSSSSPNYAVWKGVLLRLEPGVEITPYPDQQLPKCPTRPGAQPGQRPLYSCAPSSGRNSS